MKLQGRIKKKKREHYIGRVEPRVEEIVHFVEASHAEIYFTMQLFLEIKLSEWKFLLTNERKKNVGYFSKWS